MSLAKRNSRAIVIVQSDCGEKKIERREGKGDNVWYNITYFDHFILHFVLTFASVEIDTQWFYYFRLSFIDVYCLGLSSP